MHLACHQKLVQCLCSLSSFWHSRCLESPIATKHQERNFLLQNVEEAALLVLKFLEVLFVSSRSLSLHLFFLPRLVSFHQYTPHWSGLGSYYRGRCVLSVVLKGDDITGISLSFRPSMIKETEKEKERRRERDICPYPSALLPLVPLLPQHLQGSLEVISAFYPLHIRGGISVLKSI